MARGQKRNRAVVTGSQPALDQLKYEIAREVGLQIPADNYWGNIASRDNGAVGGHMVRRMIQFAEQQLAQGATMPKPQDR